MGYTNNNSKQEYLKQSVMTASPSELVVMLFDSCIKNLKQAEICLNERRDFDGANLHFQKSQKIILELISCLDTSYEISAQLFLVYQYLLCTIRDMNAKKNLSLLTDVLDILNSLRDTWKKVSTLRDITSSEVG
ncbi:Flagellar secretion chaperone FliS [bioreactor metagenome]|uniref:Flagellar secretion chaperone FliS n=1 Tax=bioreactor metagenome TaxID=1076179 RepID=A0A644W0Y8_9ZZZZ